MVRWNDLLEAEQNTKTSLQRVEQQCLERPRRTTIDGQGAAARKDRQRYGDAFVAPRLVLVRLCVCARVRSHVCVCVCAFVCYCSHYQCCYQDFDCSTTTSCCSLFISSSSSLFPLWLPFSSDPKFRESLPIPLKSWFVPFLLWGSPTGPFGPGGPFGPSWSKKRRTRIEKE